MTKFQRLSAAFMAVICLAVLGAAAIYAYRTLVPSREDKLAAACEAHPADCALMKRANAAIDATVNDVMQNPAPEIRASVDRVHQMRRDMEDKFIATGRYGD